MKEENSSELVGGLVEFLKMLEEMEKKLLTEKTISGEKQFSMGKAKYTYNVRIGFLNPHGKPLGSSARIMPWKSRRAITPARLVAKENLITVEEKKGFTIVTVELPTLDEEALNFAINENKLKISARTSAGTIEKELLVPEKSEIIKTAFKNGILEILLKKGVKENG